MNILIIEDEENIRNELKNLLEKEGYQVSLVTEFTKKLKPQRKPRPYLTGH